MDAPRVPLQHLGALWIQVTGLLCNLRCTHCLVDSHPGNHTIPFLSRDAIRASLREAETLGVKEVYFTGGEPFLHRDLLGILADALAVAPTTVLTNGTLITPAVAEALEDLAVASRYSLEVRVSLDHPDAAANDRVRGAGAHAKAIRAVLRLQEAGLLPIVTATTLLFDGDGNDDQQAIYDAFLQALHEAGVRRPRLKLLPVFRMGALQAPRDEEPVPEIPDGVDPGFLQCARTRAVTANGVFPCPILVGTPGARLGTGPLSDHLGPVPLAHAACRTCWETGMTCGNG